MKKRVALVGASMRAQGFVNFLKKHSDRWEIAGLFDIDPGKMKGFEVYNDVHCPHFTDFDAMCDAVRPDRVIITTVDTTHYLYVVRALDRKIEVISEKPLCINQEQCRAIWDAHLRNPEVFAVTSHNARYSSEDRKIKEIVSSGELGRILSIDYAEMLDMKHGTSYFRRWNGSKKNSGGLQLHKSCHHFDEIQWILNSRAKRLWGMGRQIYYGPKASPFHGDHCHTCSHDCPYRVKYDQEPGTEPNILFFQFGIPGGYTPDRCIFGEEIDIEDFLSATIEYQNGTWVNYHLIAHASFEGQSISVQGEHGRLDCKIRLFRQINEAGDIHDSTDEKQVELEICRYGHGSPEKIPLTFIPGSHGGADTRLFEDMFSDNPPDNLPTLEDGIQAVLVGSALNEAIKQQRPINVQELFSW